MINEKIYVTVPYLPPLEEYLTYLREIWGSRWLTNNGKFHQQLEGALSEYLGCGPLALVSNGTLGLIVALQALQIRGQVITTPYSFVATAHSLLWNNLEPVFVDIDSDTCNLDPAKIEAAITPATTAIMPVHCYGAPCQIEAIQKIADAHGLKVIYDAAHAFGVRQNGKSILSAGDLSVLSFHATKAYSTVEGGAIVCADMAMKQHIDYLKNFGFVDEVTVTEAGINAKMNELQAAFGLLQLKYVDEAIAKRRAIAARYLEKLRDVPGIECFKTPAGVDMNHSYFPILVGPDYPLSRDGLYEMLKEHNILSRRYFYPLISTMSTYRHMPSAAPANLPVATRIADQVLCLPIYPDLSSENVTAIAELIAGKASA